jgi:hypothetical protein
MNASTYLGGSVIGSTTNRSRFGASRRKLMTNAVVPTPRELKEHSQGMQPILKVGQILRNGQIRVSAVLMAGEPGADSHELRGGAQRLRGQILASADPRDGGHPRLDRPSGAQQHRDGRGLVSGHVQLPAGRIKQPRKHVLQDLGPDRRQVPRLRAPQPGRVGTSRVH